MELMPVHDFLDDKHLLDQGLHNYWGYNTTNFFAPDARYSSSGDRGQQIGEFKTMVRELHRAGIEVILDVVYNHTSEGNQMGPTLSFRGIDNSTYYRLVQDNPRYYMDYTGTGNTLNMRHPQVLKLVMDSLRYWVLDMHVDGFRFDLASALARELHDVDRLSAFFDVINQDPVLSQSQADRRALGCGRGRLSGRAISRHCGRNGMANIATWSAATGRATTASLRSSGTGLPAAAICISATGGVLPPASISLRRTTDSRCNDLVSYNEKHNEANGEENRDGANDNHSWNHGVEGPTDDPEIIELRERQKRNFLATLLLSQGVPMICGGDEISRTQNGNNNAYAQDNEISWIDWNLDDRKKALLEFTTNLITLRKNHPNLRRRKFFQDRQISPAKTGKQQVDGLEVQDICWYRPDGEEMTEDEWNAGWVRCLGVLLSGRTLNDVDRYGEPVRDDTFLFCLNPHHEHIDFYMPPCSTGCHWEVVIDTRDPACTDRKAIAPGKAYDLVKHSAVLFQEIEAKSTP